MYRSLVAGVITLLAAGTSGGQEPRLDVKLPHGSLIVHLGTADGEREISLAKDGRFLVHGLTDDAEKVSDLQARFAKAGLAGQVLVDAVKNWKTLPYPDRFVRLLVADLDSLKQPPTEAEIERVLTIDGSASLRRNGAWKTITRTGKGRIGEWTHKWYDPTGNPLSHDEIAGPPTAVQWVHGPAFADRSVGGKMPRIAGGLFVCVDSVDGSLFARDANTGLPRWRANLKLTDTADFNIADGKIYLHADDTAQDKDGRNRAETGPLVVLDLATGKRLNTFDQGIQNRPKVRSDYSIAQTLVSTKGIVQAVGPEICVLDARTGKKRWHHQLKDGFYFAPILLEDLVIVAECDNPVRRARLDNSNSARALVAFNVADGKQVWRTEKVLPAWITEEIKGVKVTQRPSLSPLIGADGMIFLHGGSYQSRAMGAFFAGVSAKDGKEIWRHIFVEKEWTNTVESSRLVVRAGVVYYLGGKGIRAFDARTGTAKTDFLKRPKYAFNGFGECSGSRGTVNWLISNGLCYWDTELKLTETWAARSSCGTGVIPANGMMYALPTGCDCISYSRGYLGLSCTPLHEPIADAERLVVAAGTLGLKPVQDDPADWPIFLANPQRTGATTQKLPDKLQLLWKTKLTDLPTGPLAEDRRHSEYWLGPLSAPTAVGSVVTVACPETGEIIGVNRETGAPKWTFRAGGKVDSPPTLYRGLALFGCHDGWVYAVRLDDGRLAWRFLAAPFDRKAILHGHLCSAFPVHGSLLVLDGKLLVTSGFHNYLGGIHGWVLDPLSGKILAKTELRGSPQAPRPAVNDILCASADERQGWLALDVGLGVDGKPRLRTTKLGQPIVDGTAPVMVIDRNAALVRFPHDVRGGSTHPWTRPMSSGPVRGQRVVHDGTTGFAVIDPTANQNHPVAAPNTVILSAIAGATNKDRKDLWKATAQQLGRKESYSALIKAGTNLYLGGGKRDSSAGFVQIVAAADGSLLEEIALPARVSECGFAIARGKLFVACEDGTLVCLGAR